MEESNDIDGQNEREFWNWLYKALYNDFIATLTFWLISCLSVNQSHRYFQFYEVNTFKQNFLWSVFIWMEFCSADDFFEEN